MPNTLLTLTPTRQARTSEAISFIISQITSNDSSTCSKGIKQVQITQHCSYTHFLYNASGMCCVVFLCCSTVPSRKYAHPFLQELEEGVGVFARGYGSLGSTFLYFYLCVSSYRSGLAPIINMKLKAFLTALMFCAPSSPLRLRR